MVGIRPAKPSTAFRTTSGFARSRSSVGSPPPGYAAPGRRWGRATGRRDELELGSRFDHLDRLTADRAGRAEQGNPCHAVSAYRCRSLRRAGAITLGVVAEDAPLVAVRERSKGSAYPIAMLAGAWLVAGVALASVTGRVKDWFVMTDELVYERLAISIARHRIAARPHITTVRPQPRSALPAADRAVLPPRLVAHDIQESTFDALVMTSACIPAFLLARRVTGEAPWPSCWRSAR